MQDRGRVLRTSAGWMPSAEKLIEDRGGSGWQGFVGVEIGAYLERLAGGFNSYDAGQQPQVVDVACSGG
jgi:hypothetical protein